MIVWVAASEDFETAERATLTTFTVTESVVDLEGEGAVEEATVVVIAADQMHHMPEKGMKGTIVVAVVTVDTTEHRLSLRFSD